MAIILIYGYSVWPAIFFGVIFSTLSAYYIPEYGIKFIMSSVIVALGSVSEALIGTFLIKKFIVNCEIQSKFVSTLKFITIVLFAAPPLCAFIGTSIIFNFYNPYDEHFNILWSTWWITDSVSMLIFTPLILSFRNFNIDTLIKKSLLKQSFFAGLMFFLLFFTLNFVIGNVVPLLNFPTYRLEYSVIPIIVWFAYKYPKKGVNFAVLLVAVIAVYYTSNGRGNFTVDNPRQSFLLMQFFVSGISITALTLSSAISEQRASADNLSKSENLFKLLFENSGTANAYFDKNFRVIQVNNISAKNLNKSADEIVGKSVSEIFNSDYVNYITEKMNLVLFKVDIVQYESYFEVSGEKRYFKIKFIPVFDNLRKIQGIQFVANDITEQKQIADELIQAKIKAEESNKLKSAFLSNVSHEIRNPIHSITGFASLIAKDNVTEEKRKYYSDIIIKSASNLLDLVNDVLDLSKIESGQAEVNYSKFNINELIVELIDLYTVMVLEKKLEIKYTEQNISDAVIFSDRNKIYHILSNLLSNAIKFTEQGHISIEVLKSKRFLKIKVSDTGTGIMLDDLENIFDRFVQGKNNLSKKYKGTGLGLAICRGYAQLLGGKIFAESDGVNGSVFTLFVPYK